MHRTLLLCFIHGFKGGDDTFGKFHEDLRALVEHALPKVTVRCVIYPKYETRGDLSECVSRFREWLQNKVIDLEVAASTPSPTVDPSVHTILIGHSMGGIVAAETFLAICSDAPIPPSPSPTSNFTDPTPSTAAHTDPAYTANSTSSLIFPYIAGILAFDTPYLGISPSVIAYGAENHIQNASSTYSAFTAATSFFGGGASKSKPTSPTSPNGGPPVQALPPPTNSGAAETDAAATPAWQRWGKYAMFAGAAGAVAAGGAAAYLKREKLTEGWGWIGSHLEFVGCLAKPEELRRRLERVGTVTGEKGVGFKDMVTLLGKGADRGAKKEVQPVRMEGADGAAAVDGDGDGGRARERTFCTLPKSEGNSGWFEKSVNDIAKDETEAHMTMFERKANSHYYALSDRAKELLVEWVEGGEWYRSSEPRSKGHGNGVAAGAGGSSFGAMGAQTLANDNDNDDDDKEGRSSMGGLMDVDLNDNAEDEGLKDSVWVEK